MEHLDTYVTVCQKAEIRIVFPSQWTLQQFMNLDLSKSIL